MPLSLDEFLDRTSGGIEAFVASLQVATREPERIGFFVAHDVAFAARLFGWRKALTVAEPLILPMLTGTVLRSERADAKKFGLSAALAVGTANQKAKTDSPEHADAVAVAAKIAQYAAYGLAVRGTFDATVRPVGLAARAGLTSAGVVLAAIKNPKVAWASALGGATMSWATEVADDPKIRDGNTHAQGIGHGANLMVAGETLSLIRATLLKGRNGFGARATEAVAMSLSSLGQMLIVDGVARYRMSL